jgi:DNA mismatch repair protein MutL
MALAYPEVEWFYASDDEVMLDLKSQNVERRVTEVFGKSQFGSMFKFDDANELMAVNGFLGKPNFARKSRVEQFVFLNRRFIFSRMINHAVFQAYEHLLEKGSFPFFILNLTIDPKKIDVNVHPSKMEVKFENESNVYRIILSVVRKALAANNLIPSLSFQEGNAVSPFDAKFQFSEQAWKRGGIDQTSAPVFPLRPDVRSSEQSVPTTANIIGLDDIRSSASSSESPLAFDTSISSSSLNRVLAQRSALDQSQMPESRPIWQAHNKYIISQIPNGLMIIDQHAAHERILFEKFQKGQQGEKIIGQRLLIPEVLNLTPKDFSILQEVIPVFKKAGIELEPFSGDSIVIKSIPAVLVHADIRIMVVDAFEAFSETGQALSLQERQEKILALLACRGAIKASQILTKEEVAALCEDLDQTLFSSTCPHGRPVYVRLDLRDLEKMFKRR